MKSSTHFSFRAAAEDEESGDEPRLLSFPFGVPAASSIPLQAFEKSTNKKRKYKLESEFSGIKFQGCNFGVHNVGNDLTSFSIGVYDEKTGVMELHSVGHTFAMEQQVDENAEVPAALSAASMTAMERRQSLTDTFGSKKKKRALKAAESNIISSQNIVAADTISGMLMESVAEKDRDLASQRDDGSAPQTAMEQHRQMMLPPFVATATSLKEAYPLSGGLVPRHVMSMLHEWVENCCGEMSGGGCADDWRSRFTKDPLCPKTVLDIFDESVAHHSDKKFKKYMASLMMCDAMIRLAVALTESSKPVLKETAEQLLKSPPAQLLRHLTDSFAVFKKSFGKGAFVSTKSLM
jgi:hypothetical protein